MGKRTGCGIQERVVRVGKNLLGNLVGKVLPMRECERDLFSFRTGKESDGSVNGVLSAEQHHDVLGFENGVVGRIGMGDPGTHEGHDGCPGP